MMWPKIPFLILPWELILFENPLWESFLGEGECGKHVIIAHASLPLDSS